MKRFIGFLIAFMVTLFVPAMLMAQTGGESVGFDPAGYLATFALYITTLLLIVEFVVSLVKNIDARKIIIWVVAVLLGVLGFVFKLGIFYTTWYVGLLYILAGGAVGTGYLTTEQGQMLVDLIKGLFKSKETLKEEAQEREAALRAKNNTTYNK